MVALLHSLAQDDRGFIVSAELVIVASIAVLAIVVGISEATFNINQELEDVGSAVGYADQTFEYHLNSGHKARIVGSSWSDTGHECESECDVRCDGGSSGEN